MAELEEPGKGMTSYAFSPKGIKQTDSKSKVKPAPIELSQVDAVREKYKERDSDKDVAVTRKGTKIGHRRIDEDGQITYKKAACAAEDGCRTGCRNVRKIAIYLVGQRCHLRRLFAVKVDRSDFKAGISKEQPSSALVSAIQLGIQYSVGRLSSKQERDVLMGDFYEIESVYFPSNGHQETPAHHYSDFRFKAYAPVAFRYFRELFHIAADGFLISLCHEALRELTNPGASGSLFYLSMDDLFIIKTIQHKEAEFLQKLLPGYYLNLNQNKRTLLPKFFGLYCYQCGGKNIRLVVMNNILPSGYKIHLKYDLKGSTFKRKASKAERAKSSPTLKDLDFMKDLPGGISLDADTYNVLTKTIQRDCRVLESFKIMDYSLLLAIHNVDEAAREKRQARGEPSTAGTKPTEAVATTNNANEDRQQSEKSTNELAKGLQAGAGVTRYPSGRNRDDFAANWEAIPQDRDDETPYGAIRARNSKGDRLLVFIGLIDILQSYRLKKRLEHGFKSVVQDGDSISVHRPSFYSRRFQEFMAGKVFCKIPDSKPQITRSPSKKRASFNTGKGRDRMLTPSDSDKHGQRSGENSAKPRLSPSLDAGLDNVPGDVSFMGQDSLETVPMTKKQTNSLPENITNISDDILENTDDMPENTDDMPGNTDDMPENIDDMPENTDHIPENTDDIPKNTDDIPENTDDILDNTDDNTQHSENVPSTAEANLVSDGETPAEAERRVESSNDVESNPEQSTENLEHTPGNPELSQKNPEHIPKDPDNSPNNVATSSESEDKRLSEVSENERIDSSSDSEPLTVDSRI